MKTGKGSIRVLLALIAGMLLSCRAINPEKPDKRPDSKKSRPDYAPTTLADLDRLFDLESLPHITMHFSRSEWENLLREFDTYAQNEKYIQADFTWQSGSQTLRLGQVGFRLRGNSFSRKRPEGRSGQPHDPQSPDWRHAHFRVDFDRYAEQRFFGLKALNLKWFKDDPTYVREIYCYDLFRRFGVLPALRSSYVRLTIQVEGTRQAYFGIYQMLEPVDSLFLEKRFPGNDKGYLWKCLYPATLETGGARAKMGIEDPDNRKIYAYDLKTKKKDFEKARDQLLEFIENLNDKQGREFEVWVEKALDVDMFLRTLAVHVLVGMWDDFWNLGNNYYLYFDEQGRATFIPYDYDNTLGTTAWGDYGRSDVLAHGRMDGSRPLAQKILAISRYRELYQQYLAQLLEEGSGLFDPAASMQRIAAWHQLIADHVPNDTGQDTEILDEPADWGRTGYYRLWEDDSSANYFMVRRNTALQQLGLGVQAYNLLRLEVDAGDLSLDRLVLKGQQPPLDFISGMDLRDDGLLGDSRAGDGVWTGVLHFTNTYRILYRVVGLDQEGRTVGTPVNWAVRNTTLDPGRLTNNLRITLE